MSERGYNRLLGNLRRAGLALGLVALVWFGRPEPWTFGIGLVLVILGETVRFWAAGHLLKTQELVTSGPYRHTRNPLYLGRLLILSGLCLMANLPRGGSWIALALGWAFFFGYYLPRKERVEPARLREVHGEAYERYRRAVPALFPQLRPYPEGGTNLWSAARMRRNREHLMVLGLALASLFWLWRMLAGGGAI
ncbi:MAG: isoprenylcysteine carboxylmethyltransferase family protein [Thermoanaerobaculia bacterium]|nr:isoprenylcysteine carboxylmethyltransferase family protein [Thermoanaerobaculia bacterium]